MNTKQLLLSAIAVTLPLWTVSAHADAAWDLFEQMKAGRCELALADVKTRAEAGEASFQRVMGVALAHGTCTSRSHGEAAAWYRKAAQQGDADAQNNLGAMYANGLGVPKDERQAVDWYRKAVEQGHATAQNNLGIMYANGQGVLQDAVQAAAWFERAARQGDAWGQRNLGLLLRDGSGVARDPIRAHAWLNLASAADKPHPNAAQEREALAEALDRAQSADAQRLAREWKQGVAMGAPRVKVANAPPARPAAPVPTRVAQGPFPAQPDARQGVTTCNTRCVNGDCYRTYGNGRQQRFQAQRKLNPFNGQWEWDSGSC